MRRFLKWLDNYWYHYKWHTIFAAFGIFVIAIVTAQMIGREPTDAYIMYIGGQAIPDTQYQDIRDSFGKVASDRSGDGKVVVNFSKTAYISDLENDLASSVNAVAREFMSTMIAQPYYVYLLTPDLYDSYKDSGIFAELDDVFPEVPDAWFYDDCTIYFGKTPFAQENAGVDSLDEEPLLLALKNIPYTTSSSIKNAELASFEYHLNLIKRIVNDSQ